MSNLQKDCHKIICHLFVCNFISTFVQHLQIIFVFVYKCKESIEMTVKDSDTIPSSDIFKPRKLV